MRMGGEKRRIAGVVVVVMGKIELGSDGLMIRWALILSSRCIY